MGAGYTNDLGHKVSVAHPALHPRMIVYDGNLASHTPLRLWLSSGMRAIDHAIEILYNPTASETPHKLLSLASTHELFTLLPESKEDPDNAELRQKLQLAAFGSLFSFLVKGGLGLSHSMGLIPGGADDRTCVGSNISDSTWYYIVSYTRFCVKA
jgi:3-oxoacid CoA-transferase